MHRWSNTGSRTRMKTESVDAFHSTQNSRNFSWYMYIKWNGSIWFCPAGIFGTSCEGAPLWLVWSFRLVGWKCPFPLDKLSPPVPLFCILLFRTITKRAEAWVRSVPGMYRSTGHVKFPKFQTGIFVEWKAPCILLQACETHVLYTIFLCIKKPILEKTKTNCSAFYFLND